MNDRGTPDRALFRCLGILAVTLSALGAPVTPSANADPAGQWSQVPTSGYAPPTARPWIVLDSPGARLYVLRDTLGIVQALPPPDTLYSLSLATGAWAAPAGDSIYAGALYGLHTATALHPLLDPARHRLLNLESTAPELGNLLVAARIWNLTGANGWGWSSLSGTAPLVRGRPGLALDTKRQRVWLCGGTHIECGACLTQLFGDVWALDLGANAWLAVSNGSGDCVLAPSATMFLDAWNDRLLVVGGTYLWNPAGTCPQFGQTSHAVWEMPLKPPYGWTALSPEPSGLPPGSFVFDSNRGRMLAVDAASGSVRANTLGVDTTWAPLTLTGSPPPPRRNAAVVFDSTADRVLVFGGTSLDGLTTYSDVWQLVLDHSTPVLVSLAASRVDAQGVHLEWSVEGAGLSFFRLDRSLDDLVWSAIGTASPDGMGRLSFVDPDVAPGATYHYRLSWSESGSWQHAGELSVTVPPRDALSIVALAPGSADAIVVRLTLRDASPARLDCFDVAGRRVSTRALDGLGAGTHTLRVDTGSRLGAGVWLLRLEQGDQRRETRAVLIR